MKLSTLLPILAAGANKKHPKKDDGRKLDQDRWAPDRFSASKVTKQCSSEVTSQGGTFETTNDGFSGEINLGNYPDSLQCKHEVQADSSCKAIKINYRDIAVEAAYYDNCDYDAFRFGWSEGTSDLLISPPRCNCFGDGCGHDYLDDNFDDYTDKLEVHLGPTEFSVNSNTFTFFFESDGSIANGHVVLDWECVDAETAASTNILSLTYQDSCSETHSGYEEFGDQVRSAIELGVANDIYYFSRKPGVITDAARDRVKQFTRWFVNIFDGWYTDVTKASAAENRRCLTNNFPYDSPGLLDQESVRTQ